MTHGHTRSKTPSNCARMVGDAKAAPVGGGTPAGSLFRLPSLLPQEASGV